MNFIKKNLKSVILFIAITTIIIASYFLIDKQLSGILGAIGFFFWFLREYTKQLFAKDLEKFKAELQNESIKFKITYEEMHTERAKAIKEVYKKIVRVYNASRACIIPEDMSELEEERKENLRRKHKIADNLFNKLRDYYDENRIFFEEEMANNLDSLIKEFKKAASHYVTSKITEKLERKITKESHEEWQKAFNLIEKEIPLIRKMIEDKFRKIIGIGDKTNEPK